MSKVSKAKKALKKAESQMASELESIRRKHGSGSEEFAKIYSSWKAELDPLLDDWRIALSEHWRDKARDYYIDLPAHDDTEHWEQSPYSRRWYLSDQAITNIRRVVREERLGELELKHKFVSLVVPIISILGAVTGTIALLGGGW